MNNLKKILFILFAIISINANAQYSDLIVRQSPIFDIIRAEILETPNNNLLTALKNNSVKKVLCYNETINKIFFTIDVNRNGLPEKHFELDSTEKDTVLSLLMTYDNNNNLQSYESTYKLYGNENYKYYYEGGLLTSYKIHADENSLDSMVLTRNGENKITSVKIYKIEGKSSVYDIYRGNHGRIDSINLGKDAIYFSLNTEDNIHLIVDINMAGAFFHIVDGRTMKEIYFNGRHAEQQYIELLKSLGSSNSFYNLSKEEFQNLTQALKMDIFTINYFENGLPESVECIYSGKPIKLYYTYEYYY